MMKKIELANGYIYHIFNRGVDKRDIFIDIGDYKRYIYYLSEFNSISRVLNVNRKIGDGGATSLITTSKKNLLVDVVCFILILNHFHLILRQLVDNGISKFMQKVETGYAMYFNKKNQRTGRLYEGHFKTKLVDTDEYLMHLSRYIHLNCLGLIEPGWKKEGIKDWDRANKFLERYKWSSYLDYIGKVNLPHIINKGPLMEYFKNPEEHKRFIQSWMPKDILKVEELIIET